LPSLQFVITDQMSLLSPLNSNDRSIPLNLKTSHKLLKMVINFPVPSREVTNQTLSGRESLGSDLPAGDGKIENLFLKCTLRFLVKEKTPGNLITEALIIILETFLQSEEIENLVVTESAAGVRCAAVRQVLREERRLSLENVGGRRPSLLLCRNVRQGSTFSAAEASAAANGNGNGKSSPRCSVDGTAAMGAGGIKRRKSLYETAVSGAEGERRWEGGGIGVMEVETSAKEDEPTPGQDTTQGEETKEIRRRKQDKSSL
jgi:hypothetical protein